MAMQQLRSSTANKRPQPTGMSDGQFAINTNSASPGVFVKDSAGALVKVGPVHVGTTAPNATPASGGQSGNSTGELWLDTSLTPAELKTWDGSAWQSATGQEIPVSKLIDGSARQLLQTDAAGTGVEWTSNVDVPGTLDVTGATTLDSTLTVPLGSEAAPTVRFSGDANTGVYSPGADQVAVATNGAGRLFVDASGNVGINRSVVSPYGIALGPVTGQSISLLGLIAGNNTNNSRIDFGDSDSTDIGRITYEHNADAMVFRVNAAERFRVDSSGRLGLGTSSAAEKLHVEGNGRQAIRITNSTLGSIASPQATAIDFYGYLNNSRASIEAEDRAANQVGGWLNIKTANASGVLTTAIHVNRAQQVGIGTTSPTQKLQVTDGTYSNFYIAPGYNSDGGTLLGVGGAEYLSFATNGLANEQMRIDSSGRLLVGTSTARSNFAGNTTTPLVQIEGVTAATASSSITRGVADSTGPTFNLGKTRGASPGLNTVVASGDQCGIITFQGADGTNLIRAAQIEAAVDGTPGTNDMPGRLVFSTTADGASAPTERMRIASNGQVNFTNSTGVVPVPDNALGFGTASFRWAVIYAANGTIQTSDERAKTGISSATLGTDFIKALRPVSYKWIEGGKRDTGERDENNNYIYETVPGKRTHWGFIAQEVKQAVDAAGVDFGGWVLTDKDDPDSQQALRYDQFIAPLTKALQEALEKIESLEARLTAAGIA